MSIIYWRNLGQHRLRTVLSALAVALGVGMTVAANVTSGAIMNALSRSRDAQTLMAGLLGQLDAVLTLVGVAITFAAGFVILNAFAMSIAQRRWQIGLLRSLGMTRAQVMRTVLAEALVTGGLGTVVGLAAGPLFAYGVIALARAALSDLLLFEAGSPSLASMLLAATVGMGVTLLATLVPARQATRVSPLAALREQEAVPARRREGTRYGLAGAAALVALAVYLIVAPPGEWVEPPWDTTLTGVFALVWLGGLVALLPAVIGGVGRWARRPLARLGAASGRLVADNVQRARGRVTLTALTLALSLALIVALTGFIRFTFSELMRPRIEAAGSQSPWIVAPFAISEGMAGYSAMESLSLPPGIGPDAQQALQGQAQVVEWHFVVVPELSFFGDSYFSFALDPRVAQQAGDWLFAFTEGDWETALPIMENGCGVLVMPLVASKNGVTVGDALTVTGAGGPIACTVAGIGSTYVGASIISSSVNDALGVMEPIGLLIQPLPGADWGAIKAELDDLAARYPGVRVTEMAGLVGLQMQVIDGLPTMLSALLVLAIVAAALGVVNTTVMSVAERRRELALLRAVGATRRQTTRIVTGEAALLGVVGGGVGLVAGAGIVVIIAVTYGGNAWGMPDLDLWAAAGRALQPALFSGLVGLLAAPFICAAAAWLPARATYEL